MCLDIEDFATTANATVWTWPCGDGSSTNEFWTVGASFIQSRDATPGMCLRAGYPGDVVAVGTAVTTAPCDGSDAAQALVFSPASGLIVHSASGLCFDGATALDFCSLAGHSAWTVCDPAADITARAVDLVSRLSVADKIAALGTGTPALGSVGLPAYGARGAEARVGGAHALTLTLPPTTDWWSEATHGINRVRGNSASEPFQSNTALPITTVRQGVLACAARASSSPARFYLLQSCSFNRSLWKATGNTIGREARAFMNGGNAYGTYWACVGGRLPPWTRRTPTYTLPTAPSSTLSATRGGAATSSRCVSLDARARRGARPRLTRAVPTPGWRRPLRVGRIRRELRAG